MTKDICYIAQRSSNPNLVKSFLEALPPGTLESGVATIPDEDVRKRFKLRSPSMTKALIKLGVDADVVAGYYAAFAKQESEEGRVYHMTTFPNADIMMQQSETKHFKSCMAYGKLDGDSGGSYYIDYIDDDIEAYRAGDLGLFVVGQHAHDIQVGDTIYYGNGIGFVARAKIRVMYKYNKRRDKLERAALLVDRIYGNESRLVGYISTLLEWNSANFNLPVIVHNNTMMASDKEALQSFVFFGEDYEEQTLFFPHDGYMDSMSQSSNYLGGFDCRSFTVSYGSDWGIINPNAKIWNCGLQYKTYSLAKFKRTAPLNTIPIAKHFIERASNKLVCRHESTSRDSWRYDYFVTGRKDDLLLRLQVQAMKVFVSHYFRAFYKMYEEYFKMTPLLPLWTGESDHHMCFALGEDCDIAVAISSWFSYRGRLEFIFGFYHACSSMKGEELKLSSYEYESSTTAKFNLNKEKGSATLITPVTYDDVAQVVRWFPSRFDREETAEKLFEFVDTFVTNLKELCENPSLDKSRRMRYNSKRVKKVLKPLA